nr:hypothetical protein CTI12_AA105810 [Tanacetum cinerariifolium]
MVVDLHDDLTAVKIRVVAEHTNNTAKYLWDALERQMRGSEYDEQDRKATILYEYDTFKATEGEQLLDTYLREPKRKKAKKDVFTVNLYYDGLFTSCPLIYFQGQCRVLTDTNFDEMTYVYLLEILKRGNIEYGVNEKTPQVDLDENQIDPVYKDALERQMRGSEYDEQYRKATILYEYETFKATEGEQLLDTYLREPKRKKAKKDVFAVNLYYDGLFTSCPLIYFQGQCRVLTDTKFDEMTYVYLLEILKTLVSNGLKRFTIVKVIDMYVDHFGYDIIEMVAWDRNEELRKTMIKSESDSSDDDYHYSDDDLGNIEYGVNEKTPQVDPDENQIDPVYKGDEGNQASKKLVKKHVKKPIKKLVNKKPDSQSGEVFKEIIKDLFMPLRKMRDEIRQKFMIDVSVGQCKRAKQLVLFDHEGGLIEHYAKLYQYRQALLDSNPGSTCTIDVVESDNGFVSFKRMYIYFKGVKDGWLAGCRKVIGLDGCFLKHTCRGELLTAMGRDANNQMRCATFNGISKSFNRAILGPRMKPIINMLEEIRLYIMQRLVAKNKLAFSLEDTITSSIRKREWIVFPSGFQELEVRKGDRSYGVSLQHKTSCKKDPQPKPEVEKKPPGRNKQVFMGQCASRGSGRSGRGDGNDGSGSSSGVIDDSGSGNAVNDGSGSGGRGGGRAGEKGKKGGGRGGRGSERGSRGGVFLSSSSWGILTAKEEYQLE